MKATQQLHDLGQSLWFDAFDESWSKLLDAIEAKGKVPAGVI
jgi:hypothetical protein